MENLEDKSQADVSVQACTSSKVGLKLLKAMSKNARQQSYMPFLFKNKK